ncbi:short-chain dehydrogenase/reductase 2 [Beauveria brongniartii RCEF 3172]|uniref:Short-chain dehydrogenase/reductase 3 n=1 Tax=Beauveria brongniartii RCEF 3172 TaxID=1081107 RepID=A0A166S1U7_9HYPO|nr:short-chain dehydrogenase/reductase 2 [Beauveria brongniartii RCEF 3172]
MSLMLQIASSTPAKALIHLNGLLLSPSVSGSLLCAFIFATEEKKLQLLKALHAPPSVNLEVVKRGLQMLLGLSVVRYINSTLSSIALNSWRLTKPGNWKWDREIAVITGGCSGIGKCTVERLAKRGVRVAIFDIQEAPESFQNNARIRFFKCDITDGDSVAQAADRVREHFGEPSILINNAGITKPFTIMDMPMEVITKVFQVNCFAHWTTVQEFLPHMMRLNKGHVVTVASLAGHASIAKAADYCASKSAAIAFHEVLGAELRSFHGADGVMTSVVNPNFVRTPFLDSIEGLKEVQDQIPMLTPEQVADCIAAQIFSRTAGEVNVPSHMGYITGFRGWPHWIQIFARDSMGKAAASIK